MLFDRFSFREREGGMLEEESVADLPASSRGYSFTFDTRQLVFLIAGYCFLCVLVFALGVVVGRAITGPDTPQKGGSPLATLPSEQPPKSEPPKGGPDVLAGSRIPLIPTPESKSQALREPEFTFSPRLSSGPSPGPGESSSPMPPQTTPAPAPELPQIPTPLSLTSRAEPQQESESRRPEMAAPKPRETPTSRTPTIQGGDYTIQVSSFRSLGQASELKGRLSHKGYEVYVQSVDLQDKGTWHRVRVGHYRDKEKADRVASDIRHRESLPAMVIRR